MLLISGLPQRGTRSSGATKLTAAGDVARLLGEAAKKIVASEDFAAFPFLFLECLSDQIHCGGGARSGPRGVREFYAASPDGSQWAVTRRYGCASVLG